MKDYQFTDFLETIAPQDQVYADEINTLLLDKGCRCEIKTAKSGFIVSYLSPQSGKTLATFVCRKTGVKLRIFPQHINKYEGFLDTLPEKMKKDIRKSSPCKRLLDPDACNPKCSMGFDFRMDGENQIKCRYMAFMPNLNPENIPFIKAFLDKELTFQSLLCP